MIGTITATTTGVISLRSPPPISIKSLFQDVLNTNPAIDRTVMRRRPNSLYEVLRVDRTATPTEIKTAYRSLAKVYHPDASDHKHQGNSNDDDRDFIEIYNAYETLKDPVSRASYDLRWNGGVIGLYTVVGRRQGDYRCRRWETDQCW